MSDPSTPLTTLTILTESRSSKGLARCERTYGSGHSNRAGKEKPRGRRACGAKFLRSLGRQQERRRGRDSAAGRYLQCQEAPSEPGGSDDEGMPWARRDRQGPLFQDNSCLWTAGQVKPAQCQELT
jgi:hypothetical protein